ncbi:zinc ribbon domain-containing protein [Streptomyces sp. NPDC058751]|uniref:zinc ribbon domain-containing protein n=1 Tax=Streptomyces sp. NPDC058751 TaxID=3346623 RepID=UPI00369552FF
MPAFCPHCGGAVTDKNRFCTSCGRPLAAPASAPDPVPVVAPPVSPQTSDVALAEVGTRASAEPAAEPTPTAVDLPVDVPPATQHDAQQQPVEETSEAVPEQAAEEPSEQAVEDAAEEAPEEATSEETTEEAAEEAPEEVVEDAAPTPPPAPPARTPAAGLLKTPTAAHPGGQPQAAPAGAGNHAAAFAALPTGNMAYPGYAHQVVHYSAPQPERRRIGWGVITVTLVATAVLAGGVTAAGVWLTSQRPASQPHTTRATEDAVVPGTGTPAPPAAPAPVAPGASSVPSTPSTPSTPSDTGVSSSAPVSSPADIVRQVQDLLDDNDSLRTRVQKAVTDARNCAQDVDPVRDARDDLEAVADARESFVRKIDPLKSQATGDLAEALDALALAWTESAEADRAYSLWASGIVDFMTNNPVYGCTPGSTQGESDEAGPHNKAADKAKHRFAELWNPIASRYGLAPVDEKHI